MNGLVAFYPQILVVVFAALFVVTFLTLLRVRRQLEEQDGLLKRLSEFSFAAIDDTRHTDSESVAGQAFLEELNRLRHSVESLSVDKRTPTRVPDSPKMAEAVALARQGVDAKALVERFAIARGEAELLIRLHSQSGTEGAM